MGKGAYFQPSSNSVTIGSLGVFAEREGRNSTFLTSALILWRFLWTLRKYFSCSHHYHKHLIECVARVRCCVRQGDAMPELVRQKRQLQRVEGSLPGWNVLDKPHRRENYSKVTISTSWAPAGLQCRMLSYMISGNTEGNAMRCNCSHFTEEVTTVQKALISCPSSCKW